MYRSTEYVETFIYIELENYFSNSLNNHIILFEINFV